MKKIALIMAMGGEAAPIVERLALQGQEYSFHPQLPFRVFHGNSDGHGSIELQLVTGGLDYQNKVDNVGTVPAALMTYLVAVSFAPDMIINAGTAGGLASSGCAIGDVYLSSGNFGFHDRRIPIPGFEAYGRGGYPSYDTSVMAEELQLKRGVVSTGDSLDMTPGDLEIIRENKATIKDMEAASIAWVSMILGIPMFAVKAITDLIDAAHPTEDQFLENLESASMNLQEKTIEILDYLSSESR